MSSNKSLNQLIEDALGSLDLVLSEVLELSRKGDKELYQIGKLGRSIGLIREFQAPLFEKYPELKPDPPWPNEEPPGLTEEQKLLVATLTLEELEAIDNELLLYANQRFQKVAMIIALFMARSNLTLPNVPGKFYAQRVKALVDRGALVGQGNLDHMRYSEVRLS